jgi:hypothetical protein
MKQKSTHLKALALGLVLLVNNDLTQAQICSNPNNLFAIDWNGALYQVNTSDAQIGSQINTTPYSGASANVSNALGYSSANGKFYYFLVDPSSGSQTFVSYDPMLTVYATLANSPVSLGTGIVQGAVTADGLGYYCDDETGHLYYYNILLNTWTTITSKLVDNKGNNISTLMVTQISGDMAIDGIGNLWIVTSSTSNYGLFKLPAPLPTTSKSSITLTQEVDFTTATPDGEDFKGIAFNLSGDMYLSDANNILYKMADLSTGTLTTIGTINVSNGNTISDLTSCSFPVEVLPLSWTSFTTAYQDQQVSINWTIGNASQVKGFNVEKSVDGNTWKTLTYTGFNEESNNYTSSDPNPVVGANYYRIEEIDMSGNSRYSSVSIIQVAGSENNQIALWPNPAHDVVYVQNNSGAAGAHAVIYDDFGKMVYSGILNMGANSINVSNFPSGTYIFHVLGANGSVYNNKLIKR